MSIHSLLSHARQSLLAAEFRRRQRALKPARRQTRQLARNASRFAAEPLEPRVLLAAPELISAIDDQVFTNKGALTIGVDAFDADADDLVITAVSDNPNLEIFIPTTNRFARLNFIETGTSEPAGSILVELFEDRAAVATDRFITHALNAIGAGGELDPDGEPFYTDVIVHRVVPNFVIQTGDKLNGNGTGGSPLGPFDDVFDENLSFEGPGALAMANSGPDTNGSQFFITTGAQTHLTPHHEVFGHMIFGQMIGSQDVYNEIIGGANSQYTMTSVDILEPEDVQGGSITFRSLVDEGLTANVTVTLDDGTGNVVQQTISVEVLHINDQGPIYLQPGDTHNYNLDVSSSDDSLITALDADLADVNAALDNDTLEVDITVGDTFVGFLDLNFAAQIEGSLSSATRTTTIFSETRDTLRGLSRVQSNAGTNIFAFSSVVDGDTLYVANGSSGLEVWNIADAHNPVQIGGMDTAGEARDVIYHQGVIYLADIDYNDGTRVRPGEGLVAIDVSDPANLTRLDTLNVGGLPVNIAAVGDTIFVAANSAGLVSVDISDPSDLVVRDSVVAISETQSINSARDVILRDGLAYVSNQTNADGNGSFAIIDITDPDDLQVIFQEFTGGNPWGIDLVGDILYVASQTAGLRIFDVSDNSNPDLIQTLAVGDTPWQVAADDDGKLYVSTTRGVTVVDASDSENPTVEYVYQGPLTVVGESVIGRAGEVQIYDDLVVLPFLLDGLVLASSADNFAPTATGQLNDVTVQEDADDLTIDLTDLFADADFAVGETLSLTASVGDASLISTSIANASLTLNFLSNAFGDTTVTVRATDTAGEFVEQAFAVSIESVDDAPLVTDAIDDVVQFGVDIMPVTIDLRDHFTDPDQGHADDLTFAATSDNTALVGASIDGFTLTLTFIAGAEGQAEISVEATNLEGASTTTTLDVFVTEANTPPFVDTAIADALIKQGQSITIDLADVFADSDPGDVLSYGISTTDAQIADLMLVGSMLTVQVPEDATGSATVTVVATDIAGAEIEESFLVTAESLKEVILGDGGFKQIFFTDADGSTAKLKLNKGAAILRFDADDLGGIIEDIKGNKLELAGDNLRLDGIFIETPDEKGVLKVTGKGGDGVIDVAAIDIGGDFKLIVAKIVNLHGDLTIDGSLKKLQLNDVDAGDNANTQIDIGAGGSGLIVQLNDAANLDFSTATSLKNFTVNSLVGETNTIAAPDINKLLSKNALAADIDVAGEVKNVIVKGDFSGDFTANYINKVVVKGDWMEGLITLDSATSTSINNAKISGAMRKIEVRAAGDIKAITADLMDNARLYAGVIDEAAVLPTSLAELNANGGKSIKKVTLKFSSGDAFVNSIIAAREVGKLKLREVNTDGSALFGVVGDTIKKLVRDNADKIKKADDPGLYDTENDYRVLAV